MIICTDSPDFAARLLPQHACNRLRPTLARDLFSAPIADGLLAGATQVHATSMSAPPWTHLLITESSADSQCDKLIEILRSGAAVPDRMVCVAGTGPRFHGFKGRSWSAAPGNLHIATHFAPDCAIERFDVAFTILAALSVVEALDEVRGLQGRCGIRWVNDIVVDGAKIGGVLAYTQTRGRIVTSAILGIGLNVEVTPAVGLTPFVPAVSCVRDLLPGSARITQRAMLGLLLGALRRNYDQLLQAGYQSLLERYRQRSIIIDRQCTVCTDESDTDLEVIAAGRVTAIGDGLELRLEGSTEPVTRGRLLMDTSQTPYYGASPMPGRAGSRSNDQDFRADMTERQE